jgi:hypothetical protein
LSRTLSDDGVFFNTTKQKMCGQARLQHFATAGGGGLFQLLFLIPAARSNTTNNLGQRGEESSVDNEPR